MPQKPTISDAKLTAQDVYQLTQETLRETFDLDMNNSQYDVQTIWDVLITAAVERLTIDSASQLLEAAPSANTVRNSLKQILSDEGLVELEQGVNELLIARLPPKLLNKRLVCAVDYTDIPYHGQHETDDERVRRGRAKSGTTHFHSFGTLTVLHRHKRYTVALTLFRKSDKAHHGLNRLLDRGFDSNGVVALLKGQAFPSIIALSIRGKTGALVPYVLDVKATRPLMPARAVFMRMKSSRYGLSVNTAKDAIDASALAILLTLSLVI